jgi:glycosyltransferase involved in cell wall biosynthesis
MNNNVLFVINVISHYQVPLFSKISKMRDGKIDVVSVRDLPATRKTLGWSFNKSNINFSYSVLQEKMITVFGRTILFSPGIIKSIFSDQYSVVVIGGYYTVTAWITLFLSKLRGGRVVLRSGTHKYSVKNNGRIARLLKRFFIARIDRFVAYGTLAKEYLVSLGADPDSIFIEYDTVDVATMRERCRSEMCLEQTRREEWKGKLGLEGKTVLYVGQLVERKNVITIIRAAERLKETMPQVTLVIVGTGNEREMLESYVDEKHLHNVSFTGAVPHAQVVEYYMAANVFVVMSISDPYPLVVNEAMSFGCPVVLSRNCGNSVDLVNGNGFVVEDPQDDKGLAKALKNILEDDQLAEAMSQKSYELIKRYDIDNAAQAINSAIESAILEK